MYSNDCTNGVGTVRTLGYITVLLFFAVMWGEKSSCFSGMARAKSPSCCLTNLFVSPLSYCRKKQTLTFLLFRSLYSIFIITLSQSPCCLNEYAVHTKDIHYSKINHIKNISIFILFLELCIFFLVGPDRKSVG